MAGHDAEGLITIAYGSKHYIKMAIALSRSYARLGSTRPFAVVTDQKNAGELSRHFDCIIPIEKSRGAGVAQKLFLDQYSPFQCTLFVDSDCLFYKNPEQIWRLYSSRCFGIAGWRYLDGASEYERENSYAFVDNMKEFLNKNRISRMPHLNSGLIYFDRSNLSREVFRVARAVYARRSELGMRQFKNSPVNDEPAFAAAMAVCGVELIGWCPEKGMETTICLDAPPKINVLEGKSRTMKGGVELAPALLHFNVGAQDSTFYRREMTRLALESRGLRSGLVTEVIVATGSIGRLVEKGIRHIKSLPLRWQEKGLGGVLPDRFTKAAQARFHGRSRTDQPRSSTP